MTGSTVRPPAYQQLADELRAEITSGRLQPGERLPPEPELCVKIGVSRSTVREALRLLASQHLIVTTRGVTGGSFVAHPDARQLGDGLSTGFALLTHSAAVGLADLLELRRALEVPAAGMAAIRREEAHLTELRGALFDPGADDVDTMLAAHSAFHRTVAKATGNPLFELVGRPLYQASYGEEVIGDLPEGYWRQIDIDHRSLLDALAARDPEGATRCAAAHLDFIARTVR
ncbi:FadR/GntR family transcriptional regulator [Actinoplanes utahensis]|uniref:GntR family transcriptional regulator n=1 Tax=Actinoplanes utahensis TaxID=1869 RepID=A0A0A6UNP5_ACTUT|nr:FadR/GntR family transcriptional regulator [Actinoplanes utahensis]KHD77051.1 GntR family transcriptional regulator [Actinoplanes utahensis]GIF33098.1 GntR family transcriptional regulator [Actinoplanes utahensis]